MCTLCTLRMRIFNAQYYVKANPVAVDFSLVVTNFRWDSQSGWTWHCS